MGSKATEKARAGLQSAKAKAEEQQARVSSLESDLADLEGRSGVLALERAELGDLDAPGVIAREIADLRSRLVVERSMAAALEGKIGDARQLLRMERASEYEKAAAVAKAKSDAHNAKVSALLEELTALEGCGLTRPVPFGGIPKSVALAIESTWLEECADAVQYGDTLPPRPEMPPAIDLWPH